MSRITQITHNSTNQSFDIGATFDNVYFSNENNFTLIDLYNYLDNFFNQGTFVMYSKQEPADVRVKVWYEDLTDNT